MYLLFFLIFGIFLGAFANYAAAAWAWTPKRNHPWCRAAYHRPFWWKIPVIGWLGMKQEADRFGRGFWIRPLCIELGMGAFAAWFFQTQVVGMLVLVSYNNIPVTNTFVWSILARCAFQLVFIGLMLGASLIDYDEKTIPDRILIGGTLFALTVAFFTPYTIRETEYETEQILPVNQLLDFSFCEVESSHVEIPAKVPRIRYALRLIKWAFTEKPQIKNIEQSEDLLFPLNAAAPNPPLDVLRSGKSGRWGLISALLCWWGWCFALMERHWRMNRGFFWAWRIFWERLKRTPSTRRLWNLMKWGTFAILFLWATAWPQWLTVWSTLLGMGVAGGFMWILRLAAQFSMDREAMGFGDVLLMAMFGAFLGWQPCVVLFFLAPFAGLIPALLRLIFVHDPETPFGPFLCCGALVTMLLWPFFWALTLPIFRLGPHLITLGLGLLLLMVILLTLIRWVEKLFGFDY